MRLDSKAFEILAPAKNVGYGRQDLSSARDRQIRQLMLEVGEQKAFGQLTQWLPRDASRVLTVFAERAASMAVRRQDTGELRVGLTAAAIAYAGTDDQREVIPILALLYRAAELIGSNPAAEFSATNELTGGTASFLIDFTQRPPEHRTIRVMGYVETTDDQGFKFQRTW